MNLFIADDSNSLVLFAGSGTITITEWNANGRCKGTFSGSFVDPANPTDPPVQVSNGVFDVVFTP